ncbi:hypothetical protein M427DRAFT_386571 [Gonapodya prolifera JEL478]|uniref:VWFA domain-containing protein n=1 Tax=Gonapodya prolifera (strain JEL478) TaxID=1344416 RepID=A0A139A800_GONPJ|nr:hypothetical protein M427DRAFT_386571 [Gonapodya prolifera JEL478]|eukprot:KXS12910.1 hypothetical protein M427DRAFT_386571 [Gonapodya prolifera JEL478]
MAGIVHVVFLIDITGSMGPQIAGVKEMVHRFCSVDRPNVQLHIHTFTEMPDACYVTASPMELTQTQVADYVRDKLALNSPPDTGVTNASGGDGPENHAAGVASLTQKFTQEHNIVCFLITDAVPHYRDRGRSREAVKESEWLEQNGFPTDVFKVLNGVIEGLNVTFVPILYKNPDLTWFAQAAGLTDSLILFPTSTNSTLLANGLHALLEALQGRVNGETAIPPSTLEALSGFRVTAVGREDFVALNEDPPSLTAAPAGAPPSGYFSHIGPPPPYP